MEEEREEGAGLEEEEEEDVPLKPPTRKPAAKKRPPQPLFDSEQAQRASVASASSNVQFLLHSGATSGKAKKKKRGPGSPCKDDSDNTPENETQVERKRRLNRINERKKRARKVTKIETLTSEYHRLIGSNSQLKGENKDIREKIELIKQMTPRGRRSDTSTGSTVSLQPASSRPQVLEELPTLSETTSNTTRSSTTLRSNSTSTERSTTASNLTLDISNLTREQRVRLLQNELEKQQRIILQLQALRESSFGQPRNVPPMNNAAASLAGVGIGPNAMPNQDTPWLALSRALQNNPTTTRNPLSTTPLVGAPAPIPRIATASGRSLTNSTNVASLENVLDSIGSLPVDNPVIQELLQNALRQITENNAPQNSGNTNQGMR